MNATKITIATKVNAPVEKVWNFFNDPGHVTKWNNPSPDWHTPVAKNDLRNGGTFNYRMEARDGSAGFDFAGVYDEVKQNDRIAYTMGDGRKVEIAFKHQNNVTEIVEVFEAETQNSVEMQKNGWQSILDNFKTYAESNS